MPPSQIASRFRGSGTDRGRYSGVTTSQNDPQANKTGWRVKNAAPAAFVKGQQSVQETQHHRSGQRVGPMPSHHRVLVESQAIFQFQPFPSQGAFHQDDTPLAERFQKIHVFPST